MHVRPKDFKKLGLPKGEPMRLAARAAAAAERDGMHPEEFRRQLAAAAADPSAFSADARWGELAVALLARREARASYGERETPAPYRVWGTENDANSLEQLRNACRLAVAVRGALMPDAHLGYGLPIGGVLAVRAAVIPYAVGVDIACRMRLSVLDLPVRALEDEFDRLREALEAETRFGVGANFRGRRVHPVLDEDWSLSPVTARLKDKAWSQLGTSGSGNHFVEYGVLTVLDPAAGLPAGEYLALLSHSGSRGTGLAVAEHYSQVAQRRHPELPRELEHLAWLELDAEPGQEYWRAMELMGRYAAANHELIHRHIAQHLGAAVCLELENHHNFAWKEVHDGEEVIVHRKGATPAGKGVLGIIPGSMAAPGYVVRGRGEPASLNSAAHGAGRRMSRSQAHRTLHWSDVQELLKARKVRVLSAGVDELPLVYKDIESVMAAQADLVEILARFDPRLVKMAPAGEKPED